MAQESGHVTPNWDVNDLVSLTWTTAHHRDDNVNQKLAAAGHHYDSMVIDICQQNERLPEWCYTHLDRWNLLNPSIALHRMQPGKYLPLHSDLYGAYKKFNNIANQSIQRVIVFLEDHKPGHMLDIDGKVHNSWRAGDWVSWLDDTVHAAYNLGVENRYTLQITGYH